MEVDLLKVIESSWISIIEDALNERLEPGEHYWLQGQYNYTWNTRKNPDRYNIYFSHLYTGGSYSCICFVKLEELSIIMDGYPASKQLVKTVKATLADPDCGEHIVNGIKNISKAYYRTADSMITREYRNKSSVSVQRA